MILTKEQRKALNMVWLRGDIEGRTYLQFRRSAYPELGSYGCIMVKWCNMWLGIETDGHTHS